MHTVLLDEINTMRSRDIRLLSEKLGLDVRDIALLQGRVLLRLERKELILPREPIALEIALKRYARSGWIT